MMSATTIDNLRGQAVIGASAIARRLAGAARRALWDNILIVTALAIAAAMLVFASLLLANSFALLETTAATRLIAAVTTAIVIEAIGLVFAFRGRPVSIVFARRADRLFKLDERVSTAIELETGGGTDDAVGMALLRDAATRVAAVDPRKLVPLRLRLGMSVVAIAALALVVAVLVDRSHVDVAPDDVAPPPRLSQEEQAQVRDDLQRIESILSQDAKERDDAFLGAVAREVADLGARFDAGEIPDRETLAAALAELADYAGEAYALDGEAAGSPEDMSRLLDALAQNVARPSPSTPSPDIAAAPQPGAPDAADNQAAASVADEQSLDDMLAQAEAERTLSEAPQFSPSADSLGANPNVERSDYYVFAAEEQARIRAQQMNEAPQELAGGAIAGAAANSEAGDSRVAGLGVNDLGSAESENDPFEIAGDLLLEDELDAEGRRIKMDVPPEEEIIDLDPGEIVAGDWQPLAESEVTRSSFSPAIRDVVARYFRAGAEAEAAE